MPMNTLEFSLLVVAIAAAALIIVRAVVISNRRHPLSERACLAVLRLASWLECTGAAWDVAILQYRIARRNVSIEMKSTRERMTAAELKGEAEC